MRHKPEASFFSEPAGIMEIRTENSTNNTPDFYKGNFSMADQLLDCVIVNGEFKDLNSYPLEQYWIASRKQRPSFISSYNCVRGYTAIWHVKDNQLFLLSVDGYCERKVTFFGNKSARFTLSTFLSGGGKPVKADWFSGKLRVPQSEKELILTIDKGNLVKTVTLDAKVPVHKTLCGQGIKYELN
jgi:hypothetical protein